MHPSDVISIAAFAISLFALGWQLRRAWWDRPVVLVSGDIQYYRMGLEGEYRLEVGVANVGERPVTVIEWGWTYPGQNHGPVRFTPGAGESVTMPSRLEPHDRLALRGTPPSHVTSLFVYEARMTPYVRVVQRPTRKELRAGVQPERQILGTTVSVPYPADAI